MSGPRAAVRAARPALVGLAALALVLEVSLRAFGPFLPGAYRTGPEIEPDAALGWRNIPGAVTWIHRPDFVTRSDVNGQGRFGPPVQATRQPDRCRVLLLGDSYVAAEHVPYDRSVASRAAALLGPSVEVVNDAVSGYGTDQELLLFQRDARALGPDVAVVFFTVANDVWNNDWALESRLPTREKPRFDLSATGELVPAGDPSVSWWDRVRSFVGRSTFVSLVKSALVDPFQGAGVRRVELDVLAAPAGEWDRAWLITGLLVSRFAAASRESGVPVLFVAIPDPCQVYGDACAGRNDLAGSGVPQELLADLTARAGLPLVDLLPASRAAARTGPRLFHQRDIHWDVAGHELAARATVDALRPRLPARCGA